MKNQTIIISGIHRSGSTWLGHIISKHPKVFYIHEPFNLEYPKVKKPIDFWYEYIDENTSIDKQIAIVRYIESYYLTNWKSFWENIRRINSLKLLKKFIITLPSRIFNPTPLIKDPIALFSLEWLEKKIDSKIIISIRHPAAFVASIKVKNWEFDFNNLLLQEDLVEFKLRNYKNQIAEYVENPPNIIEQGILIWTIIHDVIYDYQKKHKNWYFIKNEDLSINPLMEYEKIFSFLELDFDKKVQKEIIESTTSSRLGKLKRNSKENIKSWKKRLTEEDINNIKSKTRPIWEKFYTENDW
jgi:hypothetical protein